MDIWKTTEFAVFLIRCYTLTTFLTCQGECTLAISAECEFSPVHFPAKATSYPLLYLDWIIPDLDRIVPDFSWVIPNLGWIVSDFSWISPNVG